MVIGTDDGPSRERPDWRKGNDIFPFFFIETNVHLYAENVSLTDFLLSNLWLVDFLLQKTFKLFSISVFWLWSHLIYIIPETSRAHRYLGGFLLMKIQEMRKYNFKYGLCKYKYIKICINILIWCLINTVCYQPFGRDGVLALTDFALVSGVIFVNRKSTDGTFVSYLFLNMFDNYLLVVQACWHFPRPPCFFLIFAPSLLCRFAWIGLYYHIFCQ